MTRITAEDALLDSLGLRDAFNEQLAGLTPPRDPRAPDLEANVEATPVPWVCARENIRKGHEAA